jgi:hypothetical protein
MIIVFVFGTASMAWADNLPSLNGPWQMVDDPEGRTLTLVQSGSALTGKALRKDGSLSFEVSGTVDSSTSIKLSAFFDRSEAASDKNITDALWAAAAFANKAAGHPNTLPGTMNGSYDFATGDLAGDRTVPKIDHDGEKYTKLTSTTRSFRLRRLARFRLKNFLVVQNGVPLEPKAPPFVPFWMVDRAGHFVVKFDKAWLGGDSNRNVDVAFSEWSATATKGGDWVGVGGDGVRRPDIAVTDAAWVELRLDDKFPGWAERKEGEFRVNLKLSSQGQSVTGPPLTVPDLTAAFNKTLNERALDLFGLPYDQWSAIDAKNAGKAKSYLWKQVYRRALGFDPGVDFVNLNTTDTPSIVNLRINALFSSQPKRTFLTVPVRLGFFRETKVMDVPAGQTRHLEIEPFALATNTDDKVKLIDDLVAFEIEPDPDDPTQSQKLHIDVDKATRDRLRLAVETPLYRLGQAMRYYGTAGNLKLDPLPDDPGVFEQAKDLVADAGLHNKEIKQVEDDYDAFLALRKKLTDRINQWGDTGIAALEQKMADYNGWTIAFGAPVKPESYLDRKDGTNSGGYGACGTFELTNSTWVIGFSAVGGFFGVDSSRMLDAAAPGGMSSGSQPAIPRTWLLRRPGTDSWYMEGDPIKIVPRANFKDLAGIATEARVRTSQGQNIPVGSRRVREGGGPMGWGDETEARGLVPPGRTGSGNNQDAAAEAAQHAEGQAAMWLRNEWRQGNYIQEVWVDMNNFYICDSCFTWLEYLLPPGAKMTVRFQNFGKDVTNGPELAAENGFQEVKDSESRLLWYERTFEGVANQAEFPDAPERNLVPLLPSGINANLPPIGDVNDPWISDEAYVAQVKKLNPNTGLTDEQILNRRVTGKMFDTKTGNFRDPTSAEQAIHETAKRIEANQRLMDLFNAKRQKGAATADAAALALQSITELLQQIAKRRGEKLTVLLQCDASKNSMLIEVVPSIRTESGKELPVRLPTPQMQKDMLISWYQFSDHTFTEGPVPDWLKK